MLGRGPGSNPVAFARSRRDPDPNPRPRPWPSQEEGGGGSEHLTCPAPSMPLFHCAPQQPAGGRRGGREPRHGAPRGGHHRPRPPPCLLGAACGEDRGFSWLPERLPPLPSLEQRCRLVPSSGRKNPNPGLAVARTEHSCHCVPMPVSSQTASLLGFSLTSYPQPSTQDPGGDVRSIFPSSSLPPACPRPPRCCLGKHGRAFSSSAAGTDPGLRKMASWAPPSRVTASPPSTAAAEAGRLLKPGAVDMATSRQSSIADKGKLVCCGSPGSWSAHPEFAP